LTPLLLVDVDGVLSLCTGSAWAQRRTGPTLLISVEPAQGLLPEHADVLREWADSLTGWSSTA
jgi:hypothetical protein